MPERVITTGYTDVRNTPTAIDSSVAAPEYTGVRIFVGTNSNGTQLAYVAGNDTGSVLEISNPFGTQAMANSILAEISGYKYRPMNVQRGLLDPAAEMGDGVSASYVYGGMYHRVTNFGKLMASDIEAPFDEEIAHEYGAGSTPTDRKFTRLEAQYKASLSITNQEVAAKVSKTGGNSSSFAWSLTATGWSLYSNNREVLKVDDSGFVLNGSGTFTGSITATSGYIGTSSSGFVINASSISNGKESLNDSNNGIYIGTDGISLGANSAFKVTNYGSVTATDLTINGGSINIGNGRFQVDSYGNLTASSGTFEGSIYAENIQYGSTGGYFDGAGLSSESVWGGNGEQIGYEAIPTYNVSSGIQTSLSYADSAYDAITNNGYIVVNDIMFRNFACDWKKIVAQNGTFYAICRGS